jgi:seryl-tRNA synthetase
MTSCTGRGMSTSRCAHVFCMTPQGPPLSDSLITRLQGTVLEQRQPTSQEFEHDADCHVESRTERHGQATSMQSLESQVAGLQQELASQVAEREAERAAGRAALEALQAELKARDREHDATVRAMQNAHAEQLAMQMAEFVLAQAQCSNLEVSLRGAVGKLAQMRSARDAAPSFSFVAGKPGDRTVGREEAQPKVRGAFDNSLPWSRRVVAGTML